MNCYIFQNEFGYTIQNSMHLAPLIIKVLLTSPLSKFITFAANNCGYSGSFTKIFVAAIYPLFLKAKSEASKEDYPYCHQAMKGPFTDKYWKVAEKNINLWKGWVPGMLLSIKMK